MSNYREWDQSYQKYPLNTLGWELGRPRPILFKYLQSKLLPKGKALDLCCGAGTNTIYIAQNGYDTAALDVSKTALGYAKQSAQTSHVDIEFAVASFTDLPYCDVSFDFIFDMGCFHHVNISERTKFIEGIRRILKPDGNYLLTCFSNRNGTGWNHFTRQQLTDLFSDAFLLGEFQHYPSLEGDGAIRYFYTVLMKKRRS